MNEIYFLITAFFAALFSGIFGIGSAAIMLSIGVFFISFKKIIALLVFSTIAVNISKLYLFRKYFRWDLLKFIILGAFPSVILASFFMIYASEDILKKILGFFLIANFILGFFKKFKEIYFAEKGLFVGGILFGTFSGLTGTGATFLSIFLQKIKDLKKEEFVGIIAISGFLANLIKFVIFGDNFVGKDDFNLILALIFISFLGTFLGKFFLGKIKAEHFKKGISFILLIFGIKLLFF